MGDGGRGRKINTSPPPVGTEAKWSARGVSSPSLEVEGPGTRACGPRPVHRAPGTSPSSGHGGSVSTEACHAAFGRG